MLLAWWSWRFRSQCRTCGAGLRVNGPVYIHGGGPIHAGKMVKITSLSFNRVDIGVGADARGVWIGDNAFINKGVRIGCTQEIRIGDGCQIGDECVIIDSDYHGIAGSPTKEQPIVIGPGVWLATRVIVLKGVTIGSNTVVGTGSVVTKSLPPHCFAGGVPARVLRSLK
jgi:acetyltransferase-like isoleucine patch superfamily enzyme